MKNPHILLVEDDANDEELTRLALSQHDIKHELSVARDGAEAVEFLLNGQGPIPNLVILDLKLPKLNGIEVLRKLRENPATRCLPVVIFTSSKEEVDIRNSYEAGANAFVRKPIEFTEFCDTIKGLSHFWLNLNNVTDSSL
jgi:two-component system response regulator